MKKISKEQHSFLRYAAIATFLCLVFLCLKRDSLITWISAGISLKQQHDYIESLEDSNEALLEKIQVLTTNRDSLERYARETYQFTAPGDDLYIVE